MTAEQLAALFKLRADRVPVAFGRASRELGRIALSRSKQLLTEEIYSLPEDRTAQGERRFQMFLKRRRPGQVFAAKKGDRKWVRTGHLRRSERVEVRDPYTVALVNDAVYAEPRHEAGKPGRRKINQARVAHWRDDLKKEIDPVVEDLWQLAVKEILEGR